jgi:hypothetical protein
MLPLSGPPPFGPWEIGFGKTYYLPEVVDLAPHHPTVRSSERAELELESVGVYQRARV